MEERRVVNDKAWNDLKNIKTTQTERKVEKDVLKVENLENIISTFTFNRTLNSFFFLCFWIPIFPKYFSSSFHGLSLNTNAISKYGGG